LRNSLAGPASGGDHHHGPAQPTLHSPGSRSRCLLEKPFDYGKMLETVRIILEEPASLRRKRVDRQDHHLRYVATGTACHAEQKVRTRSRPIYLRLSQPSSSAGGSAKVLLEQSGTGVTHHHFDLLTPLTLITVDRAFGACGLVLAVAASA